MIRLTQSFLHMVSVALQKNVADVENGDFRIFVDGRIKGWLQTKKPDKYMFKIPKREIPSLREDISSAVPEYLYFTLS